jgi:LysM repeat protein
MVETDTVLLASGAVTTADGRPSTYTVASGDTLEAIERRFGITADDLHYLNPFNGAVTTETLKYGTVFNLSRANRGAPPS